MNTPQTFYRTATIQGLQIAYREAGNPQNPKLVLLHGLPSFHPPVPEPDSRAGRSP